MRTWAAAWSAITITIEAITAARYVAGLSGVPRTRFNSPASRRTTSVIASEANAVAATP